MTAIDDLKAKLAALGADESLVALAGVAKKGVYKTAYAFMGLNAEWDEKDHPRDPNSGEFIDGPTGYIFGKTQKATFGTAPGKEDFDYDLKPGDVAFETPTGNLVISHADSTYSLYGANGKKVTIPSGSSSNVAANVASGKYKKVSENPGVHVDAKDKAEAADKLANPQQYGQTAAKTKDESEKAVPKQQSEKIVLKIKPESQPEATASKEDLSYPSLKPGKTTFTAKQYTEFQAAAQGSKIGTDKDGNDITSGSWVDFDGKPYLLHASPHGDGKVTAYRWVATKQQASNLEKEDFFAPTDFGKMTAIEDPTGKPYAGAQSGSVAAPEGTDAPETTDAPTKPSLGSLMTQAVTGAIPNASVKHKKYVASAAGMDLAKNDKNGTMVASGDWVEIEGKPYQVHASPNEGNFAIAKWVSTKQQASNNTYDFPKSVLESAIKIDDPTGKPYSPLTQDQAATPDAAAAPEMSPGLPDGAQAQFPEATYTKSGGQWHLGNKATGLIVSSPNIIEELEKAGKAPKVTAPSVVEKETPVETGGALAEDVPLAEWEKDLLNPGWDLVGPATEKTIGKMKTGDQVFAISPTGKFSSYIKTEDGNFQTYLEDGSKKTGAIGTPEQMVKALGQDGWTVTFDQPEGANSPILDEPAEASPDWQSVSVIPINDAMSGGLVEKMGAMPESTIVEFSMYGADAKYALKQADQWVALQATKDDWKQASPETLETMLPSVSGISVFPPGTAENDTLLSNDSLYPIEKQVWMENEKFTYQNGKWLEANGFPVVLSDGIDKTSELDNYHSDLQDTAQKILSMEPGDQLKVTKKTTGTAQILTMQEDGLLHDDSEFGVPKNPNAYAQVQFTANAANYSVEVLAAPEVSPEAQDFGGEQVFVHPISGLSFSLAPGDKVYKHKTTDHGYIIETQSTTTPINFFTQNGKLQKAKASQKNLATAYEVVDEWPGKKKQVAPVTPGSTLTFEMLDNAVAGDEIHYLKPGGLADPWTKQADGTWKSPSLGSLSHSDVKSSLQDNELPDWSFYPKDTSPDAPSQKDDESEWGSKESIGETTGEAAPPTPKKTTSPAKKTAAKKKAETLPSTVTLPNGEAYDLQPGEKYGTLTTPQGNTYFVLFKPGKYDYNQTWDSSGNQGYNYIAGLSNSKTYNWSEAAFKKQIKENNGEILAEYKIDADVVDYTKYGTDFLDENSDDPETYVSNLAFPVHTSWNGGPNYQNVDGFEGSWFDLDVDDRVKAIASYENIAGKGYATLDVAGKWASLDKSEKAKISKAKTGLATLHRAAILARELDDPDSTWTDQKFEAEIAFIAQKAEKIGVSLGPWLKDNVPMYVFVDSLKSKNNSRVFKKTLTDLDFDPYDATPAEYDAYAKSKGENYLSILTPEQQKQWTLDAIGDPNHKMGTYAQASMNQALAQAKTKVEIAAVAATLQKSLPQNLESKAYKPVLPGAASKALLKKSYSWTDGDGVSHEVTHLGLDNWSWAQDGSKSYWTDSMVMAGVNAALEQGHTITGSDESAYGPKSLTSALETMDGTADFAGVYSQPDSKALYELLGELGGGVLTGGSFNTPDSNPTTGSLNRYRASWLVAHALGDNVAKYHIEKLFASAGTSELVNHAGNPNSILGKSAHIALATLLNSHPAGKKYLNDDYLDGEERVALMKLTGWRDEDSSDGPQSWSNSYGIPEGASGWQRWSSSHPNDVLAPFAKSINTPGGGAVATKPSGVSDDSWTLAKSVSSSDQIQTLLSPDLLAMSDAQLADSLNNSGIASNAGLNLLLIPALPKHMKQLAVWAAQSNNDDNKQGVLAGIAARAKAGEFLDESAPAWVAPDGSKYPVSPGASVYKSGNEYIVTGPPKPNGAQSDKGYEFGPYGSSEASNYKMNNLSGYGYTLVFTMPNPASWDQAKAENPDLHQAFWTESEKVEAGTSQYIDYSISGALLTSELKKSDTLKADYPNLYAQHKTLPDNVRQAVFNALKGGSGKALLDVLEYKAKKGHFASMQSAGLFDASQPWLPNLSKGQISPDEIQSNWSSGAQSAYAEFFNLESSNSQTISAHLDSLLNPQVGSVTKVLPNANGMVLTKTGKSLGGMHTKSHWVDQDGNEWMTKAFNSDPNAKARVDAEVSAVQIGELFGFRPPHAFLSTDSKSVKDSIGGSYAYVQHLAPASGDFSGKSPTDLTVKQLQQAMEEHLLDWVVSNHDTHSQNLMLSPEGHVFGIDKGQAFKHFPNDKLAVGYLPPENGAPVWYDQFYNAVKSGQIDKETADQVTKHVLRRAQKIAKDKDAEFRDLLEQALKNRDFWPNEYNTREKFIDALIERKHNLADDFEAFYRDLYEGSPHSFDIDTDNLTPPTLDEHTHIALSEDFANDVYKSGIHGKALFFNSADLEDSHIMFSKIIGPDGEAMLSGEAKIRKDADVVLSNWLKSQTIEKQSVQSNYSYEAPVPEDKSYEVMPKNHEWFSWLVNGSKTVSSHNAAGNTEYNVQTLQQMDYAMAQIEATIKDMEEWESENPNKPYQGEIDKAGSLSAETVELKTMEQHNAFKSLLEKYKGYGDKVNEHKNTDQKISPHFTQHLYTASKEAVDEYKNADAAVDFGDYPNLAAWAEAQPHNSTITFDMSGDEVVFTKINNLGGWIDLKQANEDEVNDADAPFDFSDLNENIWKLKSISSADDEITNEVKVGTKVLKVTYRAAKTPDGVLNSDGELVLNGKETEKFDFGNMYEIDFGSTVIEYRPWGNQDGVKLAQQGLLKFRKKDWKDGDDEAMDEVLDVLRHMGLDLSPSDEETMELFYWRHLTGTLRDRKEGHSKSGIGKLLVDVDAAYQVNPEMSPAEEMKVLKDAWATQIGQEKVDNADWMPKFSRNRVQALENESDAFSSGKPYWLRPDMTYKELKQYYGGTVPASSLSHVGDALKIVQSGSALSSEERYRVLAGGWVGGWSSSSDAGNGSSTVVYTRQNKPHNWNSGYSEHVYYHPKVALRSHNYAFNYDNFGNIANKPEVPFTPSQLYSYSDGSNELLIKNGVSVMDDIAFIHFSSESDRQSAIKLYTDRGITSINGFPLAEVFVTDRAEGKKLVDKLWANLIAEEGQ